MIKSASCEIEIMHKSCENYEVCIAKKTGAEVTRNMQNKCPPCLNVSARIFTVRITQT